MKISTPLFFKKLQINLISISFLMIFSFPAFSQNVGINGSGLAPNSAAGLDVDFPDKGLLIPRVVLTGTANFAPLSAHVAGMIVYNTATAGDVVPGFYFNDGTKWIAGLPNGTAAGEILYWNGTSWTTVAAGLPGQYLQISASGTPAWGGGAFATLTTTAATAITGISATTGGNITSDGGAAVLSRGVCYNTVSGPTTANQAVVAAPATGTGIFTINLTGLLPVTTYYVRAYATNNSVTSYGNEITFTTTAVLPVLAATTAATAITGTSATSGGNVTSDGGSPITERGICYGITANPTTAGSKVVDPAPGTGIFTATMTGLTGGTTYYVRSYAVNSIGTAYGAQISFKTNTIPPTLVTVAASSINSTGAVSGGSMTWNGPGYSNYQYYGVAYSTVPNSPTPTYVNTNTANYPVTTPINPWTTTLTGLTPNTIYYIRAFLYVYPTGGPWSYVYGNELSFTTAPVSTAPISTVTNTTAVSGGTIAVNIPVVNARGVCWSTVPGPTLADSFTSDGTGNGTFISNITGLTDATTYYLRAYFTDGAANTFYGDELSFTTGTPKAIGDALAGGIVVYVDISGQHGLIGALADQGTATPWGCYGTVTGATGTAIFSGLANTNKIVSLCGAGTAAQLCASYTAGGTNLPGITNWYLPSKDELQIMINQKTLIGMTQIGTNGSLYWTSTEYSSAIAYCLYTNFNSPNYNQYKNTNLYVRAVRAF